MEKIELILTAIVSFATLISAIAGVGAFKKQKEHDKSETAFKNFYTPAMKLLEKHLYISKREDLNKSTFIESQTAFHKLIEDQYMFVPFNLQDAFNDFEKSTYNNKIKLYGKFCDCFISSYNNSSKACGMKFITVWRRNKLKWYSSNLKMVFTNTLVIGELIYTILIIFTIWLFAMAVILYILQWLGFIL